MSRIWIRVGAVNKTYEASIHPIFPEKEIKIDLKSEYNKKIIGQVDIMFDEYDLKRLSNALKEA